MNISVEKVNNIKGYDISVIALENDNKHAVKLMDYGAAILELLVPDKNGIVENVVLTYENLEDYIKCSTYFGMTCGRTSGRIADGRFSIEGQEYVLNKNEKEVTNLHGGNEGFSFKKWVFETFKNENEAGVKFRLSSPDMEEGYPGNADVEVTYVLNNNNELSIDYEGKTDKTTLLNMTNHAYFNLSGDYKRLVIEQHLKIEADRYIELDDRMIGTSVRNVSGTPMDFRESKIVGQDINSPYLKNHTANGYDHPWILNSRDIEKSQIVLKDRKSGRVMKVHTTYPAVVVYSYNYPKDESLKGNVIGKQHHAICLETQFEPNGINFPGLNDAVLRPDKTYNEKTIFKFSIE